MDRHSEALFDFVTAAHNFVTAAVPLRAPDSRNALAAFLDGAGNTCLPSYDLDAVLLRTLALLDRHTGGRLPTMVERYLAADAKRSAMLTRFRECVEDVLRYRGIGDPIVQRAIAVIDARYMDSHLTAKLIAEMVGTRPERLAAAFNRQTGMNVTEYLRQVRLDRAAASLVTTDKTIKEVWVAVGYSHAANFDHDFLERFGESPRRYRTRGIRSQPLSVDASCESGVPGYPARRVTSRGSVLIIDDDLGTRETVGRFLNLQGYSVSVAEDGAHGLREARVRLPNFVLLDYHLPDIDGLDCLRALRQQTPNAAIVVFTADWDVESRIQELSAFGATFLSKPSDLEDVGKALALRARIEVKEERDF